MKKLLCAAAFIAVTSASATASDFSGPYIGASAGYNWGDVDFSYEDGTTGFGDFSTTEDSSGFEAGLFAGFRHQFQSRFVLGAEAGIDLFSGAEADYTASLAGNTITVNIEKGHQFYLDLKPGFAVQPDMLIYGLIGYQQTELEGTVLLNGASLGSDDEDFSAWRFGFGLEKTFTDNVSVRAQYNYADYSDESWDYVNAQRETWGGDENNVRIGLVLNF